MRKLTEANVNLSINDLNSSDMQALSQILALAGQAETQMGGMGAGMGMDGMNPSDDLSSYEGLSGMSGPDGDMTSDVGAIAMGTQPAGNAPFDMTMDLGLDDPMGIEDELGQGIEPEMAEPGVDEPMGMDLPDNDDPALTIDDFGDDDMGADVDLGLDDEGDMEPMDMEMMEQFDRMMHLAGISRLAESEEDFTDEFDTEDSMVDVDDESEELDEDAIPPLMDKQPPTQKPAFTKDTPDPVTHDDAATPPFTQDAGDSKAPPFTQKTPPTDQPSWMRESMDAIDDIVEADEEELEDGEEQLDENTDGLYNLDLDEDAVEELSSPGIGDNRVFGPYQNELACMTDARKEIPGAMRNREVKIVHKPDGFYWQKINMNEDAAFRPKAQDICTKGIKSDKHGQYPVQVLESEQTVDQLAAQLNEQFARFLKGE